MIAGEPWFLAKDVCDALGIQNNKMAVKSLEDYQRLRYTVYTSGQGRESHFVNESGLYTLIFQSRKEEAKAFQKWVTMDVLPSIRKYGAYCQGLAGIDRIDVDGIVYYRYAHVLQLLRGKTQRSGSEYKPSKRWTTAFMQVDGFVFAEERYVLILLQRKAIKSLFEPIKAKQKEYDAQQLALFNHENQ